MQRNVPSLIRLSLSVLVLASLALPAQSQQKYRLTFDQIFRGAEPRLTRPLPNVTGWADDDHYLELRRKEGEKPGGVYAVDAASGRDSLVRDPELYRDLVGQGVDPAAPATADDAWTKLIYSKENDLYLLNTETKAFTRLTSTPGEEKNPVISPDGRMVAFTRDNNLYGVTLADGKEIQYTSDGSDVIKNGWASWLYYEEILGRPTRYRAFWWSPDGARLAFYRFDDSPVPVFPLYNAEGVHGFVEQERYPKAGDPNPSVRFGIVPASGGPVTWAAFNEKDDQYFGMPFWTPDGKSVWVQWMNRGQDTLKIYAIDPPSGKKSLVYEEHQNSWVEWLEGIRFLAHGTGFIVRTDKDGWMHLYLHAMDGTLRNRLTGGKWSVADLLAVDDAKGLVYFTARKEASTRTDLYRVAIDGNGLTRLTTGPYSHAVKVSPTGKHFVTTYSNVGTPFRMALCGPDGSLLRALGDSREPRLDSTLLGKTEMFSIHIPDGYDLPAVWTLPPDFDPAKRYPVIISVYGGPLSATVNDSWKGIGNQWLAMEGAIQMSVDHRGSGHFGKEGAALMHRRLGTWEVRDYSDAVRWLRSRSFVDSTRICITGGSYGGYATCMALTAGADFFTHGFAISSVTDWRLYDSHYVERYMDSPAENPEGYTAGAVMTWAEKYKGVLSIVHGTMDDNVHMQNSIQLISRLEDLNKHFEFSLYPGGRHGIGGPKAIHLQTELYRFYYAYILRKDFPAKLFEGAGVRLGRRR